MLILFLGQNKSTGQLSFLTNFMNFGGSLGKFSMLEGALGCSV